MKMSQWKKFVLLTDSLCILKSMTKKKTKQKKMMFIYEKKRKKIDQTA